ncbi:MAG: DUF2809 domain-containing protein [Bacteroidota bacterium]
MKIDRKFYFVLTVLVVILGILSRKTNGIPLCVGDVLYAVLIYFGLRFLLFTLPLKTTTLLALSFCFTVEFLQLCQTPWMVSLRETTFGHYAFGEGFLWIDLLCYFLGVIIVFYIDEKKFRTRNS